MQNLNLSNDLSGRMGDVDLMKVRDNAKQCLEELENLIASTPERKRKTIIISDNERPC